MIFLKGVQLMDKNLVSGKVDELKYPYRAPAVRYMESLDFTKPVTFLVGENGAGKSTLLESIMYKYEEREEDTPGMLYDGVEGLKMYANVLPEHMQLIENKKPDKHFFFRAESFFSHATELDMQAQRELRLYGRIYSYRSYGGRSLLEQSHGESFLSAFLNYAEKNTLFLLDEPEAALSPQRQLTLLVRIHELEQQGCQLVISTHSPILMGYPGADIYSIDEEGSRLTPYEETEHYQLTKYFINYRERMLKDLFR
ncbi:AAA family ATPase [Parabacteroides pacaensis]|uniref:AAA family ATPase n=1 Tax=Parabacteroides pacaensis TaxID=2086575 RepID=UPI000D0F17EB|nr:AAA family ATPase [Parabacteroides pacaensis]